MYVLGEANIILLTASIEAADRAAIEAFNARQACMFVGEDRDAIGFLVVVIARFEDGDWPMECAESIEDGLVVPGDRSAMHNRGNAGLRGNRSGVGFVAHNALDDRSFVLFKRIDDCST